MNDERLDCEQALRLLAAFLDGELQGAEAQQVHRHVEACRSCFSRAEFERRLKEHLAGLGRAPLDPAFEGRMLRLIRQFTLA